VNSVCAYLAPRVPAVDETPGRADARRMGFRFYRRVRLFPGLRVNLSKAGASLSVGRRGSWFTLGGERKPSVTLGLPGTGLRYTQSLPAVYVHRQSRLFVLLLLAIAGFVATQLAGCEHGNKQTIRLAWSAPTANSDGSTPVTPIASYNVYEGPSATALVKIASVPATATMSITLRLPSRPCVFAMSAVSVGGAESEKTPAIACPPDREQARTSRD
jgi:hypothetical protein